MTNSKGWLLLILGVIAAGLAWASLDFRPETATGAPLAQATATPTATPTRNPTDRAARVTGDPPFLESFTANGDGTWAQDTYCVNCTAGSSFPYGAGTPIPVTGSGLGAGTPVPLAAGEAHVGAVGGNTLHPSANPALTVAASYVSGDYVGTSATPWSWTACRVSGGTGQLQSVTVVDKASQSIAGELWLFDRSVTVPNDSAAWTITDADAQFLIGVVPTGTYYASAANTVSVTTGVGLPVWCNSGTTLYGAFVVRGSASYASGDLSIVLGILAD